MNTASPAIEHEDSAFAELRRRVSEMIADACEAADRERDTLRALLEEEQAARLAAERERDELRAQVNAPNFGPFLNAVRVEALAQRQDRETARSLKLDADWALHILFRVAEAHFNPFEGGDIRARVATKQHRIVRVAASALNWSERVAQSAELEAAIWSPEEPPPGESAEARDG